MTYLTLARRFGPYIALALACALAWHWHSRLNACHSASEAFRVSVAQAQIEASARAFAARQAEQAEYDRKAKASDEKHALQVAGLTALADSYKRDHRVFVPPHPGAGRATAATRQGDDSGVPAEPSTASIVVAETDFDRCTAWVAYGLDAREWALSLAK